MAVASFFTNPVISCFPASRFPDTTVADVIAQARTKFGVEEPAAGLCLQEVQLQLGVKRRIMASDEFPLRNKLAFHEVWLC